MKLMKRSIRAEFILSLEVGVHLLEEMSLVFEVGRFNRPVVKWYVCN